MFEQYQLKYLPSWAQNCIAYQIYPLGFCDCPKINPIAMINPNIKHIQPASRLEKLRHYYQYWQDIGINTIVLGPIFESCSHGYDTINYFQIDRRLGNDKLLKEIISELHGQNIKVILDGTFNHTSRLFPAFCNIKKNKKQSKYLDWYQEIDFEQNTIWKDGFGYKFWKDIVELPCLNPDNPDVKKYIFKIAQYWLKKYDIDGWRLDSAYNINPKFWREFNMVCQDIKPDCLLMGELVEQDYNQWVNASTLDTCTNYQLYQHIFSAFNQKDLWQLEEIIKFENDKYQNLILTNFVGNHDTCRIYSRIYDKTHLKQIFNLLYILPGIPCLYYGDEILLNGEKHPIHDQNLRQPMPDLNYIDDDQKRMLKHIKKLIRFRLSNNELTTGRINILHTDQKLLIIGIKTKNNFFINTSQLGHQPSSNIYLNSPDIPKQAIFTDILNPETKYKFQNNQLEIPPSGSILQLMPDQ